MDMFEPRFESRRLIMVGGRVEVSRWTSCLVILAAVLAVAKPAAGQG